MGPSGRRHSNIAVTGNRCSGLYGNRYSSGIPAMEKGSLDIVASSPSARSDTGISPAGSATAAIGAGLAGVAVGAMLLEFAM